AVHERKCAADVAVAQPGEPACLLAWKRIEMHAHGFHEHQLAQASEHALAAGALGGRFGDRQAPELAQPTASLTTVAHHHGTRQRRQQRIERAHVAAEKAADQAEAATRTVGRVADVIGPLHDGRQDPHVECLAGRRLQVAAHYVRIAAWKHDDVAHLEPYWLALLRDLPPPPP